MALLNFNANNVEPQAAFEPLPAGWYPAMIVESENKDTAAGTGSYLSLTLKIIDGPGANRQIFDNLNLVNPNVTAVEIAEKKLSAYCHATGVIQLTDSQQLHGIPIEIKLIVKVDKSGQYDPQNTVQTVRAIGSGAKGTPPVGAVGSSQPPAGFGTKPPMVRQPYQAPAAVQAPPAPAVQAPAAVAPPVAQQPVAAGGIAPWAKRKPA
jgi:hypothetical protein